MAASGYFESGILGSILALVVIQKFFKNLEITKRFSLTNEIQHLSILCLKFQISSTNYRSTSNAFVFYFKIFHIVKLQKYCLMCFSTTLDNVYLFKYFQSEIIFLFICALIHICTFYICVVYVQCVHRYIWRRSLGILLYYPLPDSLEAGSFDDYDSELEATMTQCFPSLHDARTLGLQAHIWSHPTFYEGGSWNLTRVFTFMQPIFFPVSLRELDFWMMVNYHVSARNRIRIFCKNNIYS